jgi:hypothetical protein
VRNGKKSHAESTPVSSDLDENEEEILKAHIAKLVKAGEVTLGKSGPPAQRDTPSRPSRPERFASDHPRSPKAVKFWDASALVSLLVEEAQSRACRDLYRADADIVVWQFTKTEIVSALNRLSRQVPPLLSSKQLHAAVQRLSLFSRHWKGRQDARRGIDRTTARTGLLAGRTFFVTVPNGRLECPRVRMRSEYHSR